MKLIIDETNIEYLQETKSYYKEDNRYCLLLSTLKFSKLYYNTPNIMKTAIEIKIQINKNISLLSNLNLEYIVVDEYDNESSIKEKMESTKSKFVLENSNIFSKHNIYLVSKFLNKYSNYVFFTDMYNFLNRTLLTNGISEHIDGLPTIIFSEKRKIYDNNIITVILQIGNGDCAIFLPAINYLYSLAKTKNKKFCIISFDNNHTNVMKIFFKDVQYFEFYNCHGDLNKYYIDAIKSNFQFGDIYMHDFIGDLKTSVFEYFLSYYSLPSPEEVFSQFMKTKSKLPSYFKQDLRLLRKKYKYLIGLQHSSSSVKVKTKSMKEWPIEEVQKFIDLCNENFIGVLNLDPYKKDCVKNVIDMSYVSIPQMYSLINNLDAVVGIDSFCGHIAGILGIPNITLFGSEKILFNIQSFSFRPISNNYSFYPKDFDIKRIKSDVVFQKLYYLLSLNTIKTEYRYINYENQRENEYYEWV